MTTRLSVIIPIYNSEKFLSECLDSIASQTMDGIQVIMIDDGSTDSSSEICNSYVEKNPGFEYHRKENGGTASARNLGLEYAVGEYIGFVDSDDTIEPDMFEKMYQAAEKNGADVLYCIMPGLTDYVLLDRGVYNRQKMKQIIFPAILPHIVESGTFRTVDWGNWSRLFKGDLIRDNHIRFYAKSRRCEDFAFAVECTLHSNRYVVIDEGELYHYRPNENSKSRAYTKNMWRSIRTLMEYMQKITSECNDYDFGQAISYCIFYFCTQVVRNEMKVRDKGLRYEKISQILNDSLCKQVVSNISTDGMNSEYKVFVRYMRIADSKGLIRYLEQLTFKKKYVVPLTDKLFKSKFIKNLYLKLRGR